MDTRRAWLFVVALGLLATLVLSQDEDDVVIVPIGIPGNRKPKFHPTDTVLSREEIETSARIVKEKAQDPDTAVPLYTLLTDLRMQMSSDMQRLKDTKEKYQKLLVQSQAITKNSTLYALVSQRANEKSQVAVMVVNRAYLSMATNFLCSLKMIKFSNYVIFAADRFAYQKLKDEGEPVFLLPEDQLDLGPEIKTLGTAELQVLMHARMRMVRYILDMGFHVLQCDMDAFWTADPFDSVDWEKGSLVYSANDDIQSRFLSPGFLLLRSSPLTLSFWDELLVLHAKLVLRLKENPPPFEEAMKETDGKLMNELYMSIKASAKFTVTFLDPDLFTIGIKYFVQRDTKGSPIVVHTNHLVGYNSKREALKKEGLWLLSQDDLCPLSPLLDLPVFTKDSPKNLVEKDFQLTIKVFAFDRPASLERLLASLQAAVFDHSEQVALEIFIDPTPLKLLEENEGEQEWSTNPVLEVAEKFLWTHGPKRLVLRGQRVGNLQQWIEAWYPAYNRVRGPQTKTREFALFLEDDTEVSPYFYIWLKNAINQFHDPSKLFAFSLQRPWLNVGRFPEGFEGPAESEQTRAFVYQMIGSWGTVFSSETWRFVRLWFEANHQVVPLDTVENEDGTKSVRFVNSGSAVIQGSTVTNHWYTETKGKMLTPWLAKFSHDFGAFCIYPHLPSGFSLLVNHQEKGLYLPEALGPDSVLLRNINEIAGGLSVLSTSPSSLSSLPVFDLCGDHVPSLNHLHRLNPVICKPR